MLVVEDGLVKIGLDLRIPPNLRMGAPHLWVEDNQVEIRMPEIVPSTELQRLRTGLDEVAAVDALPLTVRLQWTGEKYPVYESVTRGPSNVYFASRIVFLELKTTISPWEAKTGRPLAEALD